MNHLRTIREYIIIQERKLENIYKDASKVRINLENTIFELRTKKDKNEEIINKIVTLNDQIGKSREIQVNLQSQLDRLQSRLDVLDIEKSKLNENLLMPNKTLLKIEREKNKSLRSQLASRGDSQQRNKSSYQFAKNSNRQLPNRPQHQFIVNNVVEQQKQLQERINFLEEKKKILMDEQDKIQLEKLELDKKQSEESSRESELRKQLSTIRGNNKKTKLTQELRDIKIQLEKLSQQKLVALEKEEKEKQEYDTFSLHASEFYKICDDFSLFTPSTLADNTSNGNAQPFYQLLSKAVKRNKWLNLDHILVSTNSGNFDVYSYISTFIRELTKRLSVYYDKVNIKINNYNIKSEIGKALDNSRQLASILSIENVQKLGDLLRSCLRKLTADRSLIREQLTRFYIRYFAKMLTKHLSDWLPSKGFREMSGVDVDRYQNLVGKYSDLYVAFVLLEERINGELLANEGILIVKERRIPTKIKGEGEEEKRA
jgi:hypothetical protein